MGPEWEVRSGSWFPLTLTLHDCRAWSHSALLSVLWVPKQIFSPMSWVWPREGRSLGYISPKKPWLSCLAVIEAIKTFGLTPVYNKALWKKYTLSYKKKNRNMTFLNYWRRMNICHAPLHAKHVLSSCIY